jgi:hypothetical protein
MRLTVFPVGLPVEGALNAFVQKAGVYSTNPDCWCNREWLLKNSFQRFQLQKFVCKLLIVRLLRALKFAEITALVPFSTATGYFNN